MINIYFIDAYKADKNNGLNTYTSELCNFLERNVQITLTYVWLNAIGFHKPTTKIENQSTHLYVPTPQTKNNQKLNIDLIFAEVIIKSIGNNKDVITHFNWINHLPIARHLKSLTNCTTILTKHCIPWRDLVTNHYPSFYKINQSFENGESFRFNDPKTQQEIIGYDYIDHIITVTECAKKSLTQLFKINPIKITKIYNGLDQKQIQPNYKGNSAKLRQKYGFSLNEKLVIYAGNVNPRKGIFDVVKAIGKLAKQYPNIRLLIAGPGNYEGALKLAKDICGRITLCGSLDKQTLYDFYAMADIGIVPSYIEQCSYTCIEMMHSGLPLIVSDVDGLKEMVNDNCGLRIKIDFKKDKVELNQRDLLTKLSFLLKHPDETKKLGNNAKKYASEYFTAEKMARETVAVYEQLVEGRKIKEQGAKHKEHGMETITPMVSILIPCHNAEKYLQECLDSIYRQTFTNFELILVNDGSTDETRKIIKMQKDTRIVLIDNTKNLGVAASLNKGINLAKGKYIARMDADDVMHQDRLQCQVDFLEANASYGLVGSWQNITDITGVPIKRIEAPEDNEDIKLGMLFYNPISHPTVMISSELMKANPYDLDFNRCEDYELWFRLATKTKIKNLPKALVNYRFHSGNTITQHQKEMQQNVMELLSSELEKLGIEHTPQELMLHCAIGFGMGKKFFNSVERVLELNNWLDRIFSASLISKTYSKGKLNKFRKHLVDQCCGL